MIKPLLAAGLFVCSLVPTVSAQLPADGSIEAHSTARVFVSGDGKSVTIVPLLPFERKLSLVKFTGTLDQSEGKVYLAEQNPNEDFKTTFEGRPWVIVVKRGGGYQAHPPGRKEGFSIRYDETASKSVVTSHVVDDFKAQRKR